MRKHKVSNIVGIVTAVVVIFALFIVMANTAGWKRAMKNFDSSLSNGLKREVIVYDAVGNQLFRQEGKFDIDYTNDRVLYDDEKGLRHVIYFKNGIVIVNELE